MKPSQYSSAALAVFALGACTQAGGQSADVPADKPTDIAAADSTSEEVRADVRKPTDLVYGLGLCAKDEGVAFSCTVKGGKTVSICAKSGADGNDFAQYRFGQLGEQPELVWPASASEGALDFATVPYSGGGEGQIAFTRGKYQYVAYSRMVRTNFEPGEPNYPAINDGVMVLKDGKVAQVNDCDGADLMPVQYGLAEKLMGRTDELFTYESERADP